MRYAVLSDIHANLEALTAVLQDCASQHIEQYLCLGDVVGYGAEPIACLARLQELNATVVAGNHDAACVGKLDINWFNRMAKQAIEWTRDQLTFTELDLIRRWPLRQTVDVFTLVHASLRHPERFEYLVDLAQMIDTLHGCETLFCLAGHTHVSCVLEYDQQERRVMRMLTSMPELAEVTYSDTSAHRYLLNPGSVGQPRDADPHASFAIVDTHTHTIAIRRVAYDVAGAQEKIRRTGLPHMLADRLALGR